MSLHFTCCRQRKADFTCGEQIASGAMDRRNGRSVFDVEFECDSSARGTGTAPDSRGNTCRVLVRGI